MPHIERRTIYFEKPGILNTKSVIEAVGDRLEQGDIGIVLVPATTGKTAEQFKHTLNKDIKIVKVSEEDTLLACKQIVQSTDGLLGKLLRNHLKKDSERAEKNVRELASYKSNSCWWNRRGCRHSNSDYNINTKRGFRKKS